VDEILSSCPTADEIAIIDADLDVTFEHFEPLLTPIPTEDGGYIFGRTVYGTVGRKVCSEAGGSVDLDLFQLRGYQALLILRAMRFDEPLPWTDRTLFDWFVEEVDGVAFVSGGPGNESSFCCRQTRVIQMSGLGIRIDDASTWIDAQAAAPQGLMQPEGRLHQGMQSILVILVHLARVSEAGGRKEVCPEPWQDRRPEDLGPWGVEYYFLTWLADHSGSNFLAAPGSNPSFYRDVARQDAQTILETRFCEQSLETPGPSALLGASLENADPAR